MNRKLESSRFAADATLALSELDVTTGRVVEIAPKRASNDAAQQPSIKASEAMAICMAHSAIGG